MYPVNSNKLKIDILYMHAHTHMHTFMRYIVYNAYIQFIHAFTQFIRYMQTYMHSHRCTFAL